MLNNRKGGNQVSNVNNNWCRSDIGWLKMNSDGAYCQKTRKAGAGVIVRLRG